MARVTLLKKKRAAARKKNPRDIGEVRERMLKEAASLYHNFSGHEAEVVGEMAKPTIPDVLVAIGDCDGILYTTVRDGKTERYIHEFQKRSRPLLASSPDGKMLVLLGGAYDFTERGIVDR